MATYTGDEAGNIFTGGIDSDVADGNGGNDKLSGGANNDDLAGGAGADIIDGGDGDDILYSGMRSGIYNQPYYNNPLNPPVLDTGSDIDTLIGGDGSDRFFAGYGDNVDGGANGYYGDYLFISFLGAPSGVVVDFQQSTLTIGGGTITGIENISWVQGSKFADDINIANGVNNGYANFAAVFGMDGNDKLTAGYYTGLLDGGDGDDIVDGRPSQYLQSVYGGAGNDIIYTNANTFAEAFGGDGNDTIYAHGRIYGGGGNDRIFIQSSYYGGAVYGEDGDDEIHAAQAGVISGGVGGDTIFGSEGDDLLVAGNFRQLDPNYYALAGDFDMGTETDAVEAGGGSDAVWIGFGDSADGGAGSDTLHLSLAGALGGLTLTTEGVLGAKAFTLGGGAIVNFEALGSLRGTDFDDDITVAGLNSLVTIDAGNGDDIIRSTSSSVDGRGGAGDDRFVSGLAGDQFDGGEGSDWIDYSNYGTSVTVKLGEAGVTVNGPGGDQLVNIENIVGTAQSDTLTGSSADNRIEGGSGDDVIDGLGGADTMIGGAGNDNYFVDSSKDAVVEASGEGIDSVVATVSFTLSDNVENLSLTGSASVGKGNVLGNKINGTNSDNILDGLGGNDHLEGLGGEDLLTGGVGDDTINGGQGTDTAVFSGARSAYVITSGSLGVMTVSGGADGQDTLTSVERLRFSDGDYVFDRTSGEIALVASTDPQFRVFASTGFKGGVGGTGTVFGTDGFQDITVFDGAGTVTFDPSFNRGGDIIRLPGVAAAYDIVRSGSSAVLSDGASNIAIPIGGAGIVLVFDDGTRKLGVANGSPTIGSQNITSTPGQINVPAEVLTLPGGADPAAAGRLFIATGKSAAASGQFDIFGTSAAEDIYLASGDITLDPSFNRGGDTIRIALPASDFTATRSGSNVILDSEALDIRIPVSGQETKLVFDGDDDLTLVFAQGAMFIGSQAIGISAVALSEFA